MPRLPQLLLAAPEQLLSFRQLSLELDGATVARDVGGVVQGGEFGGFAQPNSGAVVEAY